MTPWLEIHRDLLAPLLKALFEVTQSRGATFTVLCRGPCRRATRDARPCGPQVTWNYHVDLNRLDTCLWSYGYLPEDNGLLAFLDLPFADAVSPRDDSNYGVHCATCLEAHVIPAALQRICKASSSRYKAPPCAHAARCSRGCRTQRPVDCLPMAPSQSWP